MNPVRGYVFDAYGTLFDVHAVVEAGREITSEVAWCNRTGAPEEELGVRADLVIDTLEALPR